MKRIEKIRELDDSIFKEFQTYFPKTLKSIFSKKYPNTLKISNLFTISSNFIKNSIFDCAEKDDLYSVKILFRSLIEHFLRFMYINLNWIEFKEDLISEKYFEFTKAKEKLEYIKSVIDENKLNNPEFEVGGWQNIFDKIPSLKKYSKSEIEKETLKYTYKNIIKALKVLDKDYVTESTFCGSLIKEYADLSSFVHGGAGSHNQMFIFNDRVKRLDEYFRICGLAYQMAATVKALTLLMIFQTDKNEFGEHYLVLDELIKKVNEI